MSGYDVRTLDIARLRPTEEVDAAHVRRIAEEMRRDGVQRRPILVERSSLAILDGHHRYHAAKTLGLPAINAVLIDYGDQRLTLSSWGETAYGRDDVLAAAASGALLPKKSTRHILDPPAPEAMIPLGELSAQRRGPRP